MSGREKSELARWATTTMTTGEMIRRVLLADGFDEGFCSRSWLGVGVVVKIPKPKRIIALLSLSFGELCR
jgi:hypothetical protein